MTDQLMEAVLVRETGGRGEWNELEFGETPRPTPSSGEVLVRIEACSVNRADLLQRRGLYPPPPGASEILGLDFAGVVVASTEETFKPDDRVFGIVAGGGYGRYATVQANHLVRIPDNLTFVEAAAAAEVFFTAYLNLFIEAQVLPGETVLIHGGGSGVGTAAIQLAREAKIRVIITAGSDDKMHRAMELGASFGINYKKEDFAARVLEVTEKQGVDVVLDWIGASYLEKHLKIFRERGRLIIIGLMGGNKAEINLATFLSKRLRMVGSLLRTRSNEEKAVLAKGFSKDVIPLLVSGKVRPIIDRVYSILEAEEAHQYMREGNHFGKIVLSWETPPASGIDKTPL